MAGSSSLLSVEDMARPFLCHGTTSTLFPFFAMTSSFLFGHLRARHLGALDVLNTRPQNTKLIFTVSKQALDAHQQYQHYLNQKFTACIPRCER